MTKYELYKDSGVEWIGGVPSHWEVLKVKNLFNFSKGKGLSKSDLDENGEYECLLYGELFTRLGGLNVVDEKFSKTNKQENVLSEGNELLIPCSTTTTNIDLCKCKTLNKEGIILGGDIIILKPFKEGIVNEFFSYFITHVTAPEFEMGGRGVTIHHIYPKQIREISIIFPPTKEQKLISRYLDKKTEQIDTLIEKIQKKIELLKEQRTSLINQCVTKGLDPNVGMKDSGIEWIGEIPKHWRLSKVKWVTTKIGSGVTPRGGGEVYSDEGVPFLRSQNIHFYGLRLEGVVYISDEIDQNMLGSRVCKNDVLYNLTGGSIGRCCLVETDQPMNVNQHVCIVRPSKKVAPGFLVTFFSSEIGQKQLRMNLGGSGREGLNLKNLGNFQIPQMSIEEQNLISSKVLKLNQIFFTLSRKLDTRIELLKEYRQSLISSVVTGKVRVTEGMI